MGNTQAGIPPLAVAFLLESSWDRGGLLAGHRLVDSVIIHPDTASCRARTMMVGAARVRSHTRGITMWLYRYETKGIQSWILDSNLLRDLAGGSALVENLTRIAEKKARKAGAADILQSTSGSMTARFPNQATLQAFASEWPMEVALKAPGLHLVHAWSPEDQGLKGLFKRLAQRRNRVHATGTEAGPWVMRAGRSGLPALNRRLQSAARQTAVDSAAVAKEAALGLFRTDKGSIVTGGRSWDEFEECLDLWPEGPVAVIHADGSGVGKRLVQLGDDHAALARF